MSTHQFSNLMLQRPLYLIRVVSRYIIVVCDISKYEDKIDVKLKYSVSLGSREHAGPRAVKSQ